MDLDFDHSELVRDHDEDVRRELGDVKLTCTHCEKPAYVGPLAKDGLDVPVECPSCGIWGEWDGDLVHMEGKFVPVAGEKCDRADCERCTS